MTLTHAINSTGLYPLSSAQSRIWFTENLDETITAYNIPLDFRITGKLYSVLLEKSINLLIERHETLRTIFSEVKGFPFQKVLPELFVPLEIVHLENRPEEMKKDLIRKHSLEHARNKFDIIHGPLCHFMLLVIGPQEYIFLLNFHQLICDASSVGIFMKELVDVYQSLVDQKPIDLPPILFRYSDYASSEKQWLTGEEYKEQLYFWKKELVRHSGYS